MRGLKMHMESNLAKTVLEKNNKVEKKHLAFYFFSKISICF